MIDKELFYANYLQNDHKQTVAKLESYGFSGISPFKVQQWYTGDDEEKTIRKYYRAYYGSVKAFIKLTTNDSTRGNEIFVNHYLSENGIRFVPQLIMYDYAYDEDSSVFATEYVDNLSHFHAGDTCIQFEERCQRFLAILYQFDELDIIHGDISAQNLLLGPNEELVLIDFGIGRVPQSEKFDINYVAHDGNHYILNGNTRLYDDAYSFSRMIEELNVSEKYKATDSYQEILNRIGRNYYKIVIPTNGAYLDKKAR